MAVNRFYSNTAVQTQLAGGINTSATSITVGSTSGFPSSTPYTLVLDEGLATEELVTVTAVAGLNLTVTRASDNTPAATHGPGAAVRHVVSARDYTEPQAHIAASSAVHGVTGALVGTTDSQTLTNKTLGAGTILPSTVVTLTGTQTVTNKNLADPSNVFPATLATAAALTVVSNALAALTLIAATKTGAETLTNKTLTAPVIGDFTNAPHDHSAANKGNNIPQSSVTGLVAALANPTTVGIQRGILNATAIVGTSTTPVVFPVPYGVGVVPVVVAGLNSAVVSTRQIGVLNVTNTGFDINLNSTSTTPVPVSWIAVAP